MLIYLFFRLMLFIYLLNLFIYLIFNYILQGVEQYYLVMVWLGHVCAALPHLQ